MSRITFAETRSIKVYLDGKLVGVIRNEREAGSDGYRYYPRGSKEGGELFVSLTACKRSLETEHG